jgi:hypothetical protein
MKFGIECEGRLTGLPTVFCSAEEVGIVDNKFDDLKSRGYPVSHIYISDHSGFVTEARLSMLAKKGYLISLECLKVPDFLNKLTDKVGIILRIEGNNQDQAFLLRPSDQIKIDDGKKSVLMCPVSMFWRTKPEDFLGDIDL